MMANKEIGIINLMRGDTFIAPIFINIGTHLEPMYKKLTPNDRLYVGVMEPNQAFEDAVIKKVYDMTSDTDDEGNVLFKLDPKDTERLLVGKYYYMIKLRTVDSFGEEFVKTIVQPTQFFLEGNNVKPEPNNEVLEKYSNLRNDSIISFESAKQEITIGLKGIGTAKICNGKNEYTVALNPDTLTSVSIPSNSNFYYMYVDDITELDLHDQEIDSLSFNQKCDINKLVVYNNHIQKLDLSKVKKLQFLHMFNNPICDNDRYKENLNTLIDTLNDRTNTSVGSILLYPWYGLEILTCKDKQGNYIKYPSGNTPLEFVEGKVYGEVQDKTITYYRYVNGTLIPYDVMNRHHTLRKKLERDKTLSKNWLFGSAIMYSSDYDKCPWDFKASAIAHMWETAEKGFGLTLGCVDAFTGQIPGFKNFNISALVDLEGNPCNYASKDYYHYSAYANGEWDHGDKQLSIVSGNGEHDQRFGYAPNSCYYLVNKISTKVNSSGNYAAYSVDLRKSIEKICYNSDSVWLSFSVAGADDMSEIATAKNILLNFGKDNIFTNSAGNHGDGLPYTIESNGKYSKLGGNNTIFVAACLPDKHIASFSASTSEGSILNSTREDYMTFYGDMMMLYDNHNKKLLSVAGTSYSNPALNAYLVLLRIIYQKLYPTETCFGKNSNFIKYIKTHWCNNPETEMDFAYGCGMPYILAEPNNVGLLKQKPLIAYRESITLGDSVDVIYSSEEGTKKGYTFEHNYSKVAVTRDNKMYPLYPTDNLELDIYSNSGIENIQDYSTNYYKEGLNIKVNPSETHVLDGYLKVSKYELNQPDLINTDVVRASSEEPESLLKKEFTVQIALDFIPEKLFPEDYFNDAGQYSALSQDIMYFINNNKWGKLCATNISYNTNTNQIVMQNARLHHTYYIQSSDVLESKFASKFTKFIDQDKISKVVLTVTCSDKGIDYFYNGTHILNIPSYFDIDIKLGDIYINTQALCHDSSDCVHIYDKVLSDKEIVQNTIAILNNEHTTEENESEIF